ncbi:hypothetical protein [Roseateles asaccharophilus]|uniref:Uncharacterized protein n=1 Tax=Roseateles asaccharophilus TaxID=582607 RepID=A0ABU2A797_9BURK|nr:hypothetical protein [Roseateles asaccharophilus]MDR7333077.1 hypothetical protein [Roseateles asaccharophilus]
MPTPNTRMNNRKPVDTVGRVRDDGHKLDKTPNDIPQSAKDRQEAIEAAEHGKDDAQPAAGRH